VVACQVKPVLLSGPAAGDHLPSGKIRFYSLKPWNHFYRIDPGVSRKKVTWFYCIQYPETVLISLAFSAEAPLGAVWWYAVRNEVLEVSAS
jgi:hypothetical protein